MNLNESTNSDPITPTAYGFLHLFNEHRKVNLKWTTVKNKSDEISETQICEYTKKKGKRKREWLLELPASPNVTTSDDSKADYTDTNTSKYNELCLHIWKSNLSIVENEPKWIN